MARCCPFASAPPHLLPEDPALARSLTERSSFSLSALTSTLALFKSSRWTSARAETPQDPKVREAFPQAERGREARSAVGRAATSTPGGREKRGGAGGRVRGEKGG